MSASPAFCTGVLKLPPLHKLMWIKEARERWATLSSCPLTSLCQLVSHQTQYSNSHDIYRCKLTTPGWTIGPFQLEW